MSNHFVNLLAQLKSVQKSVAAGALVFERDDRVVSFYQVESGLVHLVRRQEDGAEFILQRARAGDVLGEASLSSETYHCAAVAVERSVLRVYASLEVRNLVIKDVEVAYAYAQYLGKELRNARLRAEVISLKRVTDRLDAWLTWNDNRLPQKGAWHRVASEIGVSPEALYRELARRRKNMAV